MKKIFLVISCYNDYRQEHFLKYHSPRNKEYCNYHGFEYIEITDINDIPLSCRQRNGFDDPKIYMRNIVWWRFFLIRYWIETGFLKIGDIISQIDADVVIVNGNKSFEPSENKSFAYAIDSCNTHCLGTHSIRITNWSIKMLNNLLDENRWLKYKDKDFWKVFQEQACWYSLAGIKDTFADPKQETWKNFKDLGWNSTTDNEPLYGLDELYENVEILPVEYNVTVWNNYNVYFRFPTKTKNMEDVIFRHFCNKNWEKEWLNIKLIDKK